MNLILIETSGNQRYIFATNKLRENVGASELTYRIGTKFVLEAVEEITGIKLYDKDDTKLCENLLDIRKNPPLEKNPGNKIEVVISASGKALLLADGVDTAKRIIRYVTQKALKEAPGLTVHGAISEEIDLNLNGVAQAVEQVHKKLEVNRHRTPSQEQRFQRIPFVQPCATSDLPAGCNDFEGDEPKLFSSVSFAKRNARDNGYERIKTWVKKVSPDAEMIEPEEIEKGSWTAVIHADGNGLGEIFLHFWTYAKCTSGRDYLDKYRRFSLALDVCTIHAFGDALEGLKKRFPSNAKLPIVPLVLGGDDLTILCDGRYALRLTYDFLKRFEEESAKVDHDHQDGIICEVAKEAFGKENIGICAGIAIVKSHFPFHSAYDLAEKLLKSAKQVKERVKHEHRGKKRTLPCSALDYHVLYDSSGADLIRIRERLRVDESTHLYARPYIVTPDACLSNASDRSWIERRTWMELEKRIRAMRATEKDNDDQHALPNSMLHDLREGLFLGQKEADARMRLVQDRYRDRGFHDLLVKKDDPYSLFWTSRGKDDKEKVIYETNYLDALDLVEFWK